MMMMFGSNNVSFFRSSLLFGALFLIVGGFAAQADAQVDVGKANSNTASSPVATPTPTPSAIPISDVVSQADITAGKLKEIDAKVVSDSVDNTVERDLPELIRKIDSQTEATKALFLGTPSLEKLATAENDWNSLDRKLPGWKSALDLRAKDLAGDMVVVTTLEETWKLTLQELQASAQPEIIKHINDTLESVTQLRSKLEAEQIRVVGLQSKVADQGLRVTAAQTGIKEARALLVDRIFVADRPAIWNSDVWTGVRDDISQRAGTSGSEHFKTLADFVEKNSGRMLLHLSLFIVFAGALLFLRRYSARWIEKEPELKKAAIIFYLPVSTALLIAILFNNAIYSDIPPILRSIFGTIALIPTVILVRRLSERQIYPILYSLVAFFLVDQFRNIIQPLTHLSRLIFMAEMLIGTLFFLYLMVTRLPEDETAENVHGRLFKAIKIGAIVAMPIFAISFFANVFGYSSLARLLGNGVLRSSYLALILFAIVRILEGLVTFALRFRPLSLLGMVQNNRTLIQFRITRMLRWLALITWAIITLKFLNIFDHVSDAIGSFLTWQISIKSFTFSPSDIVAFGLAIWASILISRFVRFALNEDVFSRLDVPRGVPYAITTILNYVLLSIGFFFALAIIGFDLTKFAILVGALGVGIGFGMQNIVNNFLSGIILLFERPVNVGDTIQVGDDEGDLTRIGMRASVLRTFQGSEVIVPNGDLISAKVVNWTLTDQFRRLEINVGVAYGTDPHRVIELLSGIGTAHEKIQENPPPRTIFVGFGDNSLDFQLRAWTNDFDNWVAIKSDLTLGVHDALKAAGIEIPFPQRDLHLVSIKDQVADSLSKTDNISGNQDKSEK